jgi:hypothetical protein
MVLLARASSGTIISNHELLFLERLERLDVYDTVRIFCAYTLGTP